MLKIYISLLLLATLATLSSCMPSNVPNGAKKCSDNYGVTEAEFTKLSNELSEDNDAVDRRLKCFTNCLYKELNLTDDNGRLDANKYLNKFHSDTKDGHIVEVVNECNAKYSSVEDKCENVFKVAVCLSLKLDEEEEEKEVLELIRNNFNKNEKDENNQ